MSEHSKNFVAVVAEKLIEQLQNGTAPWQKPWSPAAPSSQLPFNPTTGNRYRGINVLQLMSEGYHDQRWLTYKQAAALDAQVRKGEKGTRIQFWKFKEDHVKTDDAGSPILDSRGEPIKAKVKLERPQVFFATVFNAEQVDGMPALEPRRVPTWSPIERAEQLLLAAGATVQQGPYDRAFYRPSTDCIHMPDKAQFPSADNYYAVALHELGHWTGHETRLARDLAHPFGSESYAKEELRAEIASMILGDELGIGHDPGQHAAYVAAWIKLLKDDPLEIFRAATDAEKIQGYLLSLEQRLVEEVTYLQSERALVRFNANEQDERKVMDTALQVVQDHAPDLARVPQENWLLARIENGKLAGALDFANLEQMNQIENVMDDIQPLNTSNAFWQRHELPYSVDELQNRIDQAFDLLEVRITDALVANSWQVMLTTRESGEASEEQVRAFKLHCDEAFDFVLPVDWNGRTRAQGAAMTHESGRAVSGLVEVGKMPDLWGLFAQRLDGAWQHLATVESEEQVELIRERLAWVDAQALSDEFERALRLAAIHEERVRRDPGSSDEDITAAREIRKNAEFAATINNADLQRRIEEIELRAAAQETMAAPEPSHAPEAGKTLLAVPFRDKEAAKALGAKWDRLEQSWYVPGGLDQQSFAKWARTVTLPGEQGAQGVDEAPARQSKARSYLAVPYSERGEAKSAGARWDKTAKSWYAGPKADMARLAKWHLENVSPQQSPAMTPQEEFAGVLSAAGCVVGGDHPIMDGQKHRISVVGEKFSEYSGSGFYVGHLDGHPAGYVKNNKTGEEMTWKSKGYRLDDAQRAVIAAGIAEKLQEREAALSKRQEQAMMRIARQLESLRPAEQRTEYMRLKGIAPEAGAFTDKEGKRTYLPAYDVDGTIWSMQYIDGDGTKRFAKDSRKAGCFHVVGGADALADAPAIVISEGYATAASLCQTLGFSTVAAFDSGNLAEVARTLKYKFPDKCFVIAGDDDRHLEFTLGVNPGRQKAETAAELISATLLLPVFGPEENTYPARLEPVEPAMFRLHQTKGGVLSDEQLGAIDHMRQFTDFNDLATKSVLGLEGMDRQVKSVVNAVIEAHGQMLHAQREKVLSAEVGDLAEERAQQSSLKVKRGKARRIA